MHPARETVTATGGGRSPGRAGTPRPHWLVNLLAVGFLILLTLVYFFWQVRHAQNAFSQNVRRHAGMLAGVIRLNARSTLLARKAIEETIEIFLSDTARFIDYLDAVKPFTGDELQAYRLETGLAGIRIVRSGGTFTEAPPGWLPRRVSLEVGRRRLRYLESRALYYLVQPRTEAPGVVVVGYAARRIEQLRAETGLPRLLAELSQLPGIRYVGIEPAPSEGPPGRDVFDVDLIERDGERYAQARLRMDDGRVLVIRGEAVHFFKRRRQLWMEFFVFSALIALCGALVSWILYRYQGAYLERVRRLENRLAREREDAALGRASATIAHEIRNPLNAVSMGLQRLQMEARELSPDHRRLLDNLLQAVSRTDGIVRGLKRYAQPLQPRRGEVRLADLVRDIVAPYGRTCRQDGIRLNFRPDFKGNAALDAQLVSQAVENLVKNAVEAQSDGGFIDIRLYRQGGEVVIAVENGGFSLDTDRLERLLEPYFTTKVNGSGLGLAMVSRIARAHGGRVVVRSPRQGVLRVEVRLPDGPRAGHRQAAAGSRDGGAA